MFARKQHSTPAAFPSFFLDFYFGEVAHTHTFHDMPFVYKNAVNLEIRFPCHCLLVCLFGVGDLIISIQNPYGQSIISQTIARYMLWRVFRFSRYLMCHLTRQYMVGKFHSENLFLMECVFSFILCKKKNKLNWLETYLIVSSTYSSNNQAWQCPKPKVQVVYHPRRLAEIGHFRFVILSLGFFSRTKTWQYTQKRPKISCGKAFIVASACDQIDDQSLGAIFRHLRKAA